MENMIPIYVWHSCMYSFPHPFTCLCNDMRRQLGKRTHIHIEVISKATTHLTVCIYIISTPLCYHFHISTLESRVKKERKIETFFLGPTQQPETVTVQKIIEISGHVTRTWNQHPLGNNYLFLISLNAEKKIIKLLPKRRAKLRREREREGKKVRQLSLRLGRYGAV